MQYLQYIQPTGNRQTYTDTNLAITDVNTRFVFEYLYYEQPNVPGSNWSELIGTGYPNRIMIGTMSQSVTSTPNIYVMWRNVQERVDNYTIDGTATFSKNGLTVNGTQVITISNPPSSIEAGVLCIGGVHNAAGDELVNSGIKIGRLKVYDGSDNLIGDFVPANDNGTIGFYDEVGQVFYDSDGSQPWIAGPAAASISVDASKSTLASTGETISISVSCENAWTVTGDTFLTLSSTGDTGSTTITATAPSYTGATARTDTLTFTDSVTGDEAEVSIKQKKYSAGQPFYLGADEIVEIYLGDDSISEAYLGEDLVFSTGPFEGLKVTPKSLSFHSSTLSASIKIKSSEAWTMTVPAWITASTLTGDTGDTIVSLTATTQTATTTGSIVVTSANYSASASCNYVIGVPQLQIDGVADISTSFSPYAAYTGNSNYLKCEISAEWTGNRNSGAYLYACGGGSVPFFSCERFRTNDIPYCNIGNGDVSNGPENGGGLDHTWVYEVNGNNVTTYIDGQTTQTKSISGNWPSANLSFAKYSANNLHINFYWVKFWGANNTLLAEFVPDPTGGILDKVSNTVYPKVGTGTTSYSLVIPPAS